MDWTEVLAEDDDNRRARLVAELPASGEYKSVEAKARAFVAEGGWCGATFFNCSRKLGG